MRKDLHTCKAPAEERISLVTESSCGLERGSNQDINHPKRTVLLEVGILAATPVALLVGFVIPQQFSGVLSLGVVFVSLILFFGLLERSQFSLRKLMPTVVMAALAAAGRILFTPIPSFKPVSAICIITGLVFGRRAGFMTGALAALASNFFFGQGPWTPWQMYAWGLIGYLGGCLGQCNVVYKHPSLIYAFGLLSGFLFGFIMNCWYVLAFVQPLSLQGALLAFGAAFILDTTHAASTCLFLLILWKPWRRKLQRIVHRFALKDPSAQA